MNRAFPGNPRGTLSYRIAHFVKTPRLPERARRDRPACGRTRGLLPAVHVAAPDSATRRSGPRRSTVAQLFDTPFVYVYSRQMASGLLTDEAEDEGKIAVGGEFGFGEGSSVRGIAHAYEGVQNVLRHYGMLPGTVDARRSRRARRRRASCRRRTSPTTSPARSTASGSRWSMPGADVREGQLLGRLHDFADHTSAPLEITAHRAGVVIALHFGAVCRRAPRSTSSRRMWRTVAMKITNVEVLVLKSPGLYRSTERAEEPPGPTYMGLVKVSTDAGITGYSDMETAASVAKAAVEAPPLERGRHPGLRRARRRCSSARTRWKWSASGTGCTAAASTTAAAASRCRRSRPSTSRCGTSWARPTGSPFTCCSAASGATACAPTPARCSARRRRRCARRPRATSTRASPR